MFVTEDNKLLITNKQKFEEFRKICKSLRVDAKILQSKLDDEIYVWWALNETKTDILKAQKVLKEIGSNWSSKDAVFKDYHDNSYSEIYENLLRALKSARHQIKMDTKYADKFRFVNGVYGIERVPEQKVVNLIQDAKELNRIMREKVSLLTKVGKKAKKVKRIPSFFAEINSDIKLDKLASEIANNSETKIEKSQKKSNFMNTDAKEDEMCF